MKPFYSFAALLALLSGCEAAAPVRSAGPDIASPTPLYDEARRVHQAEGLAAALPHYERAAHGGNGVASVVLWDAYATQGDDARATAHRVAALERLGDEAWPLWASRPSPDGSPDVGRIVERLEAGATQGSAAAHEALGQLRETLAAEAASGNPAAADALEAAAP